MGDVVWFKETVNVKGGVYSSINNSSEKVKECCGEWLSALSPAPGRNAVFLGGYVIAWLSTPAPKGGETLSTGGNNLFFFSASSRAYRQRRQRGKGSKQLRNPEIERNIKEDGMNTNARQVVTEALRVSKRDANHEGDRVGEQAEQGAWDGWAMTVGGGAIREQPQPFCGRVAQGTDRWDRDDDDGGMLGRTAAGIWALLGLFVGCGVCAAGIWLAHCGSFGSLLAL